MRILTSARVKALHNQYETQGSASCPVCGAPLQVMLTPKFVTSGRLTCSTFSVACHKCGVSGAVERRFFPKSA